MAESVTIHEAKTHFSKLVRRAEAGEEIVVRRGSAPVARIAPLESRRGGVSGRGSMRDEIAMTGDVAQTDREIEQLFEHSELFPRRAASPPRSGRSRRRD
ncbi:MAG: type II toxin-antitoxin system Phd/YefM family antitoxin [Solirubrobacteraceae bacterium]